MAANTRRRLTAEDVLAEIFEDSDFSGESDAESDLEDSELEHVMQQIQEIPGILREIPMEQSANPQNCDLPVDRDFGWSSSDDNPLVMPFIGESGLCEPLPDSPVALDFFNLLFDDGMWNILTEQTNLYATQTLATLQMKPHSRMQNWTPVTVDEMKVCKSCFLYMFVFFLL